MCLRLCRYVLPCGHEDQDDISRSEYFTGVAFERLTVLGCRNNCDGTTAALTHLLLWFSRLKLFTQAYTQKPSSLRTFSLQLTMYTTSEVLASLKGVLWVLWTLHWLLGQWVKECWHWPGWLLLESLKHCIPDPDKIALVPRDLPPHIQQIPDCIHLHPSQHIKDCLPERSTGIVGVSLDTARKSAVQR